MFSRSYAASLGKRGLGRYGQAPKETLDLKRQINKLEEENRILKGIIAKKITIPTVKKEK